jgi:hypothetical protein
VLEIKKIEKYPGKIAGNWNGRFNISKNCGHFRISRQMMG